MHGLLKFFSHVWPMRLKRQTGLYHPLELTYEDGELVVNSSNANQSFGTLHQLWRAVFAHLGLQERTPRTALVLGSGAGSVERILHGELRLNTTITGVEGDALMLEWKNTYFPTPEPELTAIHVADAFDWITEHDEDQYDLIIVDLFHELDLPAGTESAHFLQNCHRSLKKNGLLLFNTIAHDEFSTARSGRIEEKMRLEFSTMEVFLFGDVNRVLIAS